MSLEASHPAHRTAGCRGTSGTPCRTLPTFLVERMCAFVQGAHAAAACSADRARACMHASMCTANAFCRPAKLDTFAKRARRCELLAQGTSALRGACSCLWIPWLPCLPWAPCPQIVSQMARDSNPLPAPGASLPGQPNVGVLRTRDQAGCAAVLRVRLPVDPHQIGPHLLRGAYTLAPGRAFKGAEPWSNAGLFAGDMHALRFATRWGT